MATDNGKPLSAATRPRYKWPWFALAAVLLAILLAVLWMSKEVERMRRIHDANPISPDTNHAGPSAKRENKPNEKQFGTVTFLWLL